ncbi:MAG: HD family hydrolase [Candidatus Bipolaricaulia bacterium]
MHDADRTLRFLFEAGHLKRVRRSGWLRVGVPRPESVADHVYRTAVIGYLLATLDGCDPERTVTLCVFHDLAEIRISDLNHIAKRYLKPKQSLDRQVIEDQTVRLPKRLKETILALIAGETEKIGSGREALVARDADLLECALQAVEYIETDHSAAEEIFYSCVEVLRSSAAKQLGMALRERLEAGEIGELLRWWEP